MKTPREFRQEATVSGAHFNRRGLITEAQLVQKCQHAFTVLRQPGDQVLLGAKLLGYP